MRRSIAFAVVVVASSQFDSLGLAAQTGSTSPIMVRARAYVVRELKETNAKKQMEAPTSRSYRRAYLGHWGSFHLIGEHGTAAYHFRNGQYIADLEFSGQDANYTHYRPVANGDPSISEWAFARFPDACGQYVVWRHTRDGWRIYEQTRAWGIGLGTEVAETAVDATDVEVLKGTIENHERRIRALEGR